MAAARRFAERIQHESTRLGRLVNELLELSRLQGAEPLPEPEPVVGRLGGRRGDRPHPHDGRRPREIEVVVEGKRGLTVYGSDSQFATARGEPGGERDRVLARKRPAVTITTALRRRRSVEIASPTRASASRPTTSTGSSSGSTAPTRPGPGPPAAPASASPSSSTSPPTTAAASTCAAHWGSGSTFTLRLPARPPEAALPLPPVD